MGVGQIERAGLGAGQQIFQRPDMRVGQIGDMDLIADTGAEKGFSEVAARGPRPGGEA